MQVINYHDCNQMQILGRDSFFLRLKIKELAFQLAIFRDG